MSTLADILPAASLADASTVALDGPTRVEALVRPATDEETAATVRWAADEGLTVLPVGTGRHLHRLVAPERALMLRTDRLGGVRIYEPADLTVTAGAGTPLAELREALAPHDQWIPFDPPDVDGRTLGGLVASGGSGPLATGYGALRNHVLGATVVLGDGRVVHLGGRVVKNVAGFDLLRPMVGSLGGLGVLTEVCMRLFPVPQSQQLLVARADVASLLVGPARAVARAPVLPASAVLVAGAHDLGEGAALLVRIHGPASAVRADRHTFERVLGRPVEAVEGEDALALSRVARDHPASSDGTGRRRGNGTSSAAGGPRPFGDGSSPGRSSGIGVAWALPAGLGNVLSALDSALGRVPFSADVFAGSVRFAFDADQLPDVATVRRAVEALGGSLGVDRLPAGVDPDLADVVTAPRPAEEALTERVRAVFDPAGVYWRARGSVSADLDGRAPAAGGRP